MKRILVTGGAGFIGSFLCERLLKEGNMVICLDNYFTGCKDNVSYISYLIQNKTHRKQDSCFKVTPSGMFLLVYPIKKSQIVFVNPFWIVSAFFHTYLRYESSASEPDSAIPRSFQIKQEGFLVDDSHADKYIIGSQFSDMPVFLSEPRILSDGPPTPSAVHAHGRHTNGRKYFMLIC